MCTTTTSFTECVLNYLKLTSECYQFKVHCLLLQKASIQNIRFRSKERLIDREDSSSKE